MIGQVCKYRRNQHRVIQPRLLNWIKRQAPKGRLRDSLFLYYQKQVGTFVIAQWVVPERAFRDVLNIGKDLTLFDADMSLRFRRMLHDITPIQEIRRHIIQGERDKLWALQQENDQKVGLAKYLKNELNTVRVSMSG